MIGKMLDNRYELVEFIGNGGMALVYRAIDHRTGHSVAVKILRPEFNQDAEFLGRFEREATTASRMSHHNIVNLLDVGQDGEYRYLVMEFVRGKTLKDVIQDRGALAPEVAGQIAIRILSALQHAHKNGIIHRDIKPQNILVHSDGHIKVADFGIARVAGSSTISRSDSVMGSVHYFSPEQAQGEEVTFASDIYSVGVVLYEMLTGQPPFDGDTPVAIALQHINGKARPMHEINPAVPPAMERVVEKAMEKRPEKRYQSALEMAQDLQRALQDPQGDWLEKNTELPIPSLAQQTGRQKPLRNKKKRPGLLTFALIASAVILLGLFHGASFLYDQIFNMTEAPYLLDETEENALRMLSKAGLKSSVSRASDSVKPAGTVILQSPEYGTPMRKNETVFLTISTGPDVRPVPKVTEMSLEEARAEAEKNGFSLLALPERQPSALPWDTVLSQAPEAEASMPSGTVIQVTLSGGAVTLPTLAGKTLEEALLQIQQLQLTLKEVRRIPVKDASQFNRVAAQEFSDGVRSYAPGEIAMQQTQVTLAVYVDEDDDQARQTGEENP